MVLKSKPSAKIKRRYLLIDAKSRKEVEEVMLEYLGVLGWAKASPVFVDAKKTEKIVLSIDRKELENVCAAFEISDKKISLTRVSGTLKGLSK